MFLGVFEQVEDIIADDNTCLAGQDLLATHDYMFVLICGYWRDSVKKGTCGSCATCVSERYWYVRGV